MDGRRRTEIWKEELIGSQKREDGKEGAEMDKQEIGTGNKKETIERSEESKN